MSDEQKAFCMLPRSVLFISSVIRLLRVLLSVYSAIFSQVRDVIVEIYSEIPVHWCGCFQCEFSRTAENIFVRRWKFTTKSHVFLTTMTGSIVASIGGVGKGREQWKSDFRTVQTTIFHSSKARESKKKLLNANIEVVVFEFQCGFYFFRNAHQSD